MNDRTSAALLSPQPSAQPLGLEMSTSASEAAIRVMTEARFLMALRNPRNWEVVRQELLKDCRRPSFANSKRTYYIKPMGDNVHGLGIGFVEAAIRTMRNISVEKRSIFDSPELEVFKVTVTDLESNIPYEDDVKVSKTVERSRPLDDGSFISKRKNSRDNWTYLVPTVNEDDLLNKRAALVSKSVRMSGLKLLPDWLKEECIEAIFDTRKAEAAKDPDAERRRIIDAFASINVKVTDLVAYVGHDIGTCSPAELVHLRGMYDAICTGEATWQGYVDGQDERGGAGGGDSQCAAGPGKRTMPQARSAQPTSAQGSADQATGEIADTRAQPTGAPAAASPAPSPAVASNSPPAPAPAPAGPPCSEGMLRYILNTAKRTNADLAAIFQSLGLPQLAGLSREQVREVIEGCQHARIAGLTEDNFQQVKVRLTRG